MIPDSGLLFWATLYTHKKTINTQKGLKMKNANNRITYRIHKK